MKCSRYYTSSAGGEVLTSLLTVIHGKIISRPILTKHKTDKKYKSV